MDGINPKIHCYMSFFRVENSHFQNPKTFPNLANKKSSGKVRSKSRKGNGRKMLDFPCYFRFFEYSKRQRQAKHGQKMAKKRPEKTSQVTFFPGNHKVRSILAFSLEKKTQTPQLPAIKSICRMNPPPRLSSRSRRRTLPSRNTPSTLLGNPPSAPRLRTSITIIFP